MSWFLLFMNATLASKSVVFSAKAQALWSSVFNILWPFLVRRNEEGTWDTPDAAKLLMRSVASAHGPALEALSWSRDTPGELPEDFGLSADNLAALIQGGQH